MSFYHYGYKKKLKLEKIDPYSIGHDFNGHDLLGEDR
jgi:hypothetical protein